MGLAQPLTIFLRQEIDRMQKVITTVRNTLQDLKLAIDGTIIMSENLKDALDCMYDARIPDAWRRVRYTCAIIYLLLFCPELLHSPRNLEIIITVGYMSVV